MKVYPYPVPANFNDLAEKLSVVVTEGPVYKILMVVSIKPAGSESARKEYFSGLFVFVL
jgi:hypothetical protein